MCIWDRIPRCNGDHDCLCDLKAKVSAARCTSSGQPPCDSIYEHVCQVAQNEILQNELNINCGIQ
jgi:hypothetical protein